MEREKNRKALQTNKSRGQTSITKGQTNITKGQTNITKGQTKGLRPYQGSCCKKKKKTVKVTPPPPPPPPTKLPEKKLPTKPKINWPIAPDGYIPNSVVRSLAPFPSRMGALPPVKEEK
ncbi:hypothetical protein PO909_008430 [Leuciscus waleckii]